MKPDKSKSFSVTVLIDVWYANDGKQLTNNKDHLLTKFLYQ